jgi:hypothetical protein
MGTFVVRHACVSGPSVDPLRSEMVVCIPHTGASQYTQYTEEREERFGYLMEALS